MAIDSVHASATSQVTGAIRQAASSSGISFEYLLTTAQIESNLNPGAQASTSSAKGLYQFIEQTWLGTMKQDGAAIGYGHYADAITRYAGWTLRGVRSNYACGHHAVAQRSRRERGIGGCLHSQ